MPLAHALEVNALTLDAHRGRHAERHLVVGARAVLREAEVRDLAQGWFAGAGGAGAPCGAARGRWAHPIAICRWWRSRRPRSSGWRSRYPQIEDILPLSPLQEGLLFHALYDAQAPDVYTVQLVLGLEGPLDDDDAQGGGAGAAAAPCEPARRLPAREPQPAGADHRVVG